MENKKVIHNLLDLKKINEQDYICIDLDGTIIATVFTNDEPNENMMFYKKSTTDNRYSVLRPGVRELLGKLKSRNEKIVLLTDASANRAVTITNQFKIYDIFDFIISRECLNEIEKNTKFARRQKSSNIINYKCLVDDYSEAIESNSNCIGVASYNAIYEKSLLKVRSFSEEYKEYQEAIWEEKKYVLSWYDKIKDYL